MILHVYYHQHEIGIFYLILFLICLLITERALRFSITMMAFNLLYCYHLTGPLKDINKELHESCAVLRAYVAPTRKWILLNKYHRIFCRSYFEFSNFNRKCTRTFYILTIGLHLFVNVSIIAGALTQKLHIVIQFFFAVIWLAELCIGFSSTNQLLNTSDHLIKPTRNWFSLMRQFNDFLPNYSMKLSFRYELYHTKSPFRFQLGTFAIISRQNISMFFLFYSSFFMFVMSCMKRNSLYQ